MHGFEFHALDTVAKYMSFHKWKFNLRNSFSNMFVFMFINISQSFIKFGNDLLCLMEFTKSCFRSCMFVHDLQNR